MSERQKKYQAKNKEILSKKKKEYRNKNKEILSKKKKEYRIRNKNIISERKKRYEKQKRKENIEYKIRKTISRAINLALRFNGSSKNNISYLKYLDYSILELKAHLEKQFESWMSWDNYGKYIFEKWNDEDQSTWAWQIDHIIPQSTFKYTSMENEEFKKCWALENLRPYSAKQNIIDGANRIRH